MVSSWVPVLVDSPTHRAAIGGVAGATVAALTTPVAASLPLRIALVGLGTLGLYLLLAVAYRALAGYSSGST